MLEDVELNFGTTPPALPLATDRYGLQPGTNIKNIKPLHPAELSKDQLMELLSADITLVGGGIGFYSESLRKLLFVHDNEPVEFSLISKKIELEGDREWPYLEVQRFLFGQIRTTFGLYRIYCYDGLCQVWEVEVIAI